MSNDTEREFGDVQDIVEPMAATIIELNREVQRLKSENARLAAALVHIAEYWNGAQNEAAMYDACKHIQEFASSVSGGGAVLRDLLAPTIRVLNAAREIIFGVPPSYRKMAEDEACRLRAVCGEKEQK